ncbi:MAG: hypothetical protein ICV64_10575 [Thermoleophilia bacterium]|nr:hypothetical protein [Thermoleophilia bacterium]
MTACAQDAVWRIALGDRPGSPRSIDRIRVGDAPQAVAAGEGAVWVANTGDGTVSRIDPATGEVGATIGLGHRPGAVAVGEGFVWVAVERAPPWQRGCLYR